MNPARMKSPSTPSTAPAEPAPAPVSGPVAADPVLTITEGQKIEAAPIEAAQPIEAAPVVMTGPLDPVAAAVLAEIPDRPRKAERITPDAPSETPSETPEKKRGPVLLLGGAVAVGLLALVMRTMRPGVATGPASGEIPAPRPDLHEYTPSPARGLTV